MARSKQTIRVDRVVAWANAYLAAKPGDPEVRKGVYLLLEKVLEETGNYHGFGYLNSEWDAEKEGLREDYDDTRRRYYPPTAA